MVKQNSYAIIKKRRITEKSQTLLNLVASVSNKSVAKCKEPKYVFEVESSANKTQIKVAIEEIYKERGIKVKKVNTLNTKPKKKRMRGQIGYVSGFKKAVVTLSENDKLEDI
jgi:large subunit ribosomal protein L23